MEHADIFSTYSVMDEDAENKNANIIYPRLVSDIRGMSVLSVVSFGSNTILITN